ncbi:cyclopropane fatty acid synthase [Azoarcus sp. DD4]|uniref:DUF1365 domain-containing protein n=1 Tax=Azoarcus sp. DD4 TaxID=2027405 RepID=UPI001127D96C|nr:DUF1365 domain-containing protein [Azoarcus sp. DD4]QDF98702.1 cyclopropane fatty acid synthase [Azoarcus sp. DD4]
MNTHQVATVRTVASPLAPTACFGAVMHERHGHAHNRFVYPAAFLRLPLSQLPSLRVPLLGINRRNLFAVFDRDHGSRDGRPVLTWLRDLLTRHGVGGACDGEVVLHTMPRIVGYVFNPVSFYFCHDRDGRLRVVLAEVSNTFGEHHNYLVHHADLRPIEAGEELRARKVFHVSPFFPVRGEYRFRFDSRGQIHSVAIDYWEDGSHSLSTRVSGRAEPLTGAAMRKWLLRHPFMTVGLIARIHWQALRLVLRRARFHRKPLPPLEETTR